MDRVPLKTDALPWLQVLRGLAASLVVLGHSLLEARVLNLRNGLSAGETGFSWGYGVDVFFVISGFIMVHSAGNRFGSLRNASEFLLRRIVRIVPLYALATFGVVIVAHAMPQIVNGQPPDAGEVARSLLFIPYARISGDAVPVLAVGWTLNYEMMFYVLFAMAMLLAFRQGVVALALALCGLACAGALLQLSPVIPGFWTNPIILEFLFGIGIGVLYRSAYRPPLSLLFAAGAAALVSSSVIITGHTLPGPHFLADGIPAAVTVFTGAFAFNPAKGMLFSFFVALGDASYSLYICHMHSIRVFRELWHALARPGLPGWVFIGVAFCGACAFAFLVHRLVELPMAKWLNGKLVRRWYPIAAREPEFAVAMPSSEPA